MVAYYPCSSCTGAEVSFGGFDIKTEPDHCYGRSDRPAAPGVLGGYRCSCDCRRMNDMPEKAANNARQDGSGQDR